MKQRFLLFLPNGTVSGPVPSQKSSVVGVLAFRVPRFFLLPMFLACLCTYIPVSAQHLDEVVFGDPVSEGKHGLTSFDLSKTEVYTGQGGLKARRLLPDNKNPYQGSYPGIYGGEISFVLKVDGTKQNYFTVKFAGDEKNVGRILLNVEGKELGSRHGGNEELFMDASEDDKPVSPGAFFYRTVPIPRTLTNSKTFVTVRIRATGRFFAYGNPGVYETYQRVLESPTAGIYKAYMHTNPAFALPTGDLQGNTPSYSAAPSNGTNNLAQVKANIIARAESKITELLNGSDNLSDGNTYYNQIEILAVAYQMPYNTVAYHNLAVITKIRKAVDQLVINYNNGTQSATDCWGGCFGRQAYAVFLVYDQLTGLDDVVDLGGALGKTRRQQWVEAFKASFDSGATNRKTITAQEMDNAISVYGAALGLAKLDAGKYSVFPKVAFHHVLEACGIEEFTGPLTNVSSSIPTLGNPATSNRGKGFFMMTKKGTSHEPGWVSTDCYGNLGPRLFEFWNMSKNDANIAVYGVGNGDQRILDKAVAHNRAQTSFTYPWTQDGKKCILAEGCTCWRNVYLPGKMHYGSPVVAAAAHDEGAIGYMKQMINDGRFSYFETDDVRQTWFHYLPESIDQIAASSSSTQLPSTPGQPDYVSADEENGVVTVKKGTEMFFLTLYNRAYSDNQSAKAHHITAINERKIELKPDKGEFYASGASVTRTDNVTGDYSGNAPDKPISGYSGQVEAYPSFNRTSDYNPDRAILDFYQVRYGKYLVAMNTTKDLTKTLSVPTDMVGKSGYDVASRTSNALPSIVSIPPLTTKVYYVGDVAEEPGLIVDNTPVPSGVNKDSLVAKITQIEAFATNVATIGNVSTVPLGGTYRYNLFEALIRQLAVAKYTQASDKSSQAQADKATTDLVAAYNALINQTYPLLNPYQKVEAEYYTRMAGVQTEASSDEGGGLNLSFVDAGDWTAYEQLDFGSVSAASFSVRYAVGGTATKLEVRLGSPTGTLVGTCYLTATGGSQNWQTATGQISGITGVQNIYLVYKGGVNVNWFQFSNQPFGVYPYQKVEAENYSTMSGIETENTTDPGGGKNLSWVDNGDWTAYANADFGSIGATSFSIRYANANAATTVEVRLGSSTGTVVGICSLPSTGGNQNWQTAICPISGAAGLQDVYLVYRGGVNANWIQFSDQPFGLNPYQQVEAENYSAMSGVQTENTADTGGGKNLSWVDNGDWTAYANANFGSLSATSFTIRYANANATTTVEVRLGSPTGTLAGTCSLPSTGGNQNWQTATCPISGAAGLQNLYLVYKGGINVNWFQFTASSALNPYQKVEAENYSSMLGVQTEATSDEGKGFNLSFVGAGDWTAYANADFGSIGAASFSVRYAVGNAATSLEVRLGSPTGTLVGTCALPSTGGNQTWKTASCLISGATGLQDLYLVYKGGVNVNWFQFHTNGALNPYQKVEAENYSSTLGAQTEATSDTGGGSDLRLGNAGYWSAYQNANFGSLGSAKFFIRYANPGSATTVEIRLGGPMGTMVGTCPLVSTGSEQNWRTDSTQIKGISDYQDLYLVYRGNVKINWFRFSEKALTFNPYHKVEAEEYTRMSGVQTESTSDEGSGLNLSFVDNGDWTAYANANFGSIGATSFSIRYANANAATTVEVRLGNSTGTVVGICSLPSTGGNQNWQTAICPISGAAGLQDVYLVYRGGVNANWIQFSDQPFGLNPYQQVEAENYSAMSGVQTENTADTGGGKNLSWVDNGDWTTYANANFDSTGAAFFTIRYANANAATTVEVRLGSPTGTLVGTCSLPSTGGNQIWQTATCPISGAIGWQDMYLVYKGGVNVNWFVFIKQGVLQTQTISFPAIAAQSMLNPDFNLNATASSGLAVSYSSSDTTVATIVSGKVHLVGAGNASIVASQAGNTTYQAAALVTQLLSVTAPLKVSYQDGDTGQTTNDTVRPYLKLINEGSSAVAYNDLTVRYWFSAENYTGINTWIDYAQLGNANVKSNYVALSQPYIGATGYIEYRFEAAAGNLAAGSNSGPIKSRFANSEWGALFESNDHSYQAFTSYALNDRITLYYQGKLVWGTEPKAIAPVQKLVAYSQNQNTTTNSNTIRTYLYIANEGNVPVDYQDVSVRYWFTAEGSQACNYWIDYAKVGSANVSGQFVRNLAYNQADSYLEVKANPAAGTLYPGSDKGNIQYRIAKSDWSAFNETNDYSFKAAGPFESNSHITIYYKGSLVYGTEPTSTARLTPLDEQGSLRVGVLGNPVLSEQAEVVIEGATGKWVLLQVINDKGELLSERRIEQAAEQERQSIRLGQSAGLYLLRISTPTQSILVKIIKQ